MDNELTESYSEVFEILKILDKNIVMKIPINLLENLKNNKSKEYIPNISKTIPLDKQKLKQKTLNLLAYLNLNYWASPEEKKELLEIYNNNEKRIEKSKEIKYSLDNLFKNTTNENIEEIENTLEQSVTEYKKENIWTKFINKIKNFFKK